MRAAGALAVAALVGCTGPARLDLTETPLPLGVEWVAVLGIDGAGGIAAATGLAPVAEGRALTFLDVPDVERLEVVGYATAELDPPSEAVMRTSPLRAADPRGGRLPPARWRAAFDRQGDALGDAAARELTVDWIAQCPRVVPDGLFVSLSCAHVGCLAIAEQRGCALELDATRCGRGVVHASVSDTGKITVADSTEVGTCSAVEPPPGAAVALDCTAGLAERCTIEVRTPSVAPPLDLEVVPLDPAAPPFTDGIQDRPPAGYAAAIVALRDRVLVARNTEGWFRWFDCPPQRGAMLDIIDADTAKLVGTASAPACLTRLVRDPTRPDGAIGLIATGDGALVRIDRDGNFGAPVSLADASRPALQRPIRLELLDDPVRLLVMYTEPTVERGFTVFHAIDPTTLRITTTGTLDERAEVLGLGQRGELSVVGNGTDFLYRLSDALGVGQPKGLWGLCTQGARMTPSVIHRHAPSRRTLLPALDSDSQTLFVLDDEDDCRPAVMPWAAADGYGAIDWPRDQDHVLVGLRIGDDGAAALFDPRAARFVSGPLPLGHGPPEGFTLDGAGRIWGLLPWSAQAFRLTPR